MDYETHQKGFDPRNILTPGVLINDDHEIFIKNLKRIPEANPIIDKLYRVWFL
jgi:D-lactate dehydrogenase